MSFNFDFSPSPSSPDRSLPRHSTHNAKRNRASSRSSLDNRLSIIAEDGSNHPPLPLPKQPPPQTHNRPFSRRFLGDPPRYRDGKEPPKYTLWDVTGPKGEKLEDIRNNRYVAQRGGWKRICLVAFVVIACLVGLIVGLVVGLQKKKNSSIIPPPSASSPSPNTTTSPFPSGSYTLPTHLITTSTNCTSNPLSWKCEPAITYSASSSPSDSLATFNWIITPSSSSSSNFTISSTDNPFAIDFSSAPLTLRSPDTPAERYTFTTTVTKAVFPALNVKCFYNETQFSANLYTRKPRTSDPPSSSGTPAPGDSGGGGGGDFQNWNFAVDATQSIGGGVDVPACYEWRDGVVGGRVEQGYEVQEAGAFCSCAYKNYDL